MVPADFQPTFISCKDAAGIEAFREALNKAMAGMEMIKTTWPEPWFLVKEELETMTEPYISLTHYTDICTKHGVTITGHQNTLKDFLNDLVAFAPDDFSPLG